jgi:hypothetical protein
MGKEHTGLGKLPWWHQSPDSEKLKINSLGYFPEPQMQGHIRLSSSAPSSFQNVVKQAATTVFVVVHFVS